MELRMGYSVRKQTNHLLALCVLLAGLLLIGVFSCKGTTSHEVMQIDGRAYLGNEDPDSDHSGILVSLYGVMPPEQPISSICTRYPYIGAGFSQELWFNGADQTPIATSLTKPDGSYQFKGVYSGSYNIVFHKDGWGDIHIYSLHIKENRIIEDVHMRQLVELPSVVDYKHIFANNVTYVISSSVIFLNPCVFEGGSQVLVYPGARVEFYNHVEFMDTNRITHFLPMFSGSDSREHAWDGIVFYGDDLTVKNVLVNGASTGLSLWGERCTVRSSFFGKLTHGINAQSDYSVVDSCTFHKISSRAIIYNHSGGSDLIKHVVRGSLFYENYEGLRTMGQSVSVVDNAFISNETGIVSFSGYHMIEHNLFDLNTRAIMQQGCTITIRQNEYRDNKISNILSPAYYTDANVPVFRDNNFYQTTGYAIFISPHPLPGNIDASLNYWLQSDLDSILYDKHDNAQIDVAVNYIPRRVSPVVTAGIRSPEDWEDR